jgi:DNA uptake protein ComE-like DNA-binding protein
MTLQGIGESYAKRIIDGRPYSSIERIKEIKGIGENTYNEIKNKICI